MVTSRFSSHFHCRPHVFAPLRHEYRDKALPFEVVEMANERDQGK